MHCRTTEDEESVLLACRASLGTGPPSPLPPAQAAAQAASGPWGSRFPGPHPVPDARLSSTQPTSFPQPCNLTICLVADFLELQPHHTNLEQETSRSARGCQRGLSRWGRGASGGPAARGPGQAGGGGESVRLSQWECRAHDWPRTAVCACVCACIPICAYMYVYP